MADVRHSTLSGADLHNPKQHALESDTLHTNGGNAGQILASAGDGTSSWVVPEDVVFPLQDTVWDDYVVPLASASGVGVSAPGLIKVNDDGAGSTGVYYFGFDASGEEELFFTIQMPHRYKAGTNIKPHVHWGPSTTGLGGVVWGLEYCISNPGVASGNTTIITATGAAPGILKTQVITSFPEIVGTNLRESSLINCRFFRKGGDVADTYTADAVAMSVDIHFEVEKLGSIEEYPT